MAHFASLYNPGRHPATVASDSDGQGDAGSRLLPVRFAEEEFDIGGFWSADQPARLIAPRDGEYQLRLRTNFQHASPAPADPRAQRVLAFTVNDREIRRETYYNPAHSSGYWPTLESNVRLKLRAGDAAGARTGGETKAAGGRVVAHPVDVHIRRICS